MMWVAICFALVAVCAAQVPKTCSSPSTFESRRLREIHSKTEGRITEIAKYTYDAPNMRTRYVEEIQLGKERDYYDVLHLHNINTEYRLNLRTKKCNVSAMDRPFRHKGVMPGAKFVAEGVFGPVQLPGEHVTVSNWEMTFPDGDFYYGIVTQPDCVPVETIYKSMKYANETEYYFDFNIGITDPSVFIPPAECLH